MPVRAVSLLVVILQVAPLTAAANDNWQFRSTPYLWFAGLKGDIATIPGQPSAPLDVSPSDALDDTETSLILLVDAKRGAHGLFADFFYGDVPSDEDLVPQPIGLTLRSVSKTTILSLAHQYEIYKRDNTIVDLVMRARYWKVDTTLKFGGGLGFLAGKKAQIDESWIDPMVGIKGRIPLGQSAFYVQGGAYVGGFNVGSDLFYEFSGAVGYQWTPTVGTGVGYRMFDVDYYDDGFEYDARQEG